MGESPSLYIIHDSQVTVRKHHPKAIARPESQVSHLWGCGWQLRVTAEGSTNISQHKLCQVIYDTYAVWHLHRSPQVSTVPLWHNSSASSKMSGDLRFADKSSPWGLKTCRLPHALDLSVSNRQQDCTHHGRNRAEQFYTFITVFCSLQLLSRMPLTRDWLGQ